MRCHIRLSPLEWDGTQWGGRRSDDTVILVSHEVLQEQLTALTIHLASLFPSITIQRCYSVAYVHLMRIDTWKPGDRGVSVWQEKKL